jgi:hypothetical protein
MPKITVYFINGTTVEVFVSLVKIDPQVGLLCVKDEGGDDYIFTLSSIRYWTQRNPVVKM